MTPLLVTLIDCGTGDSAKNTEFEAGILEFWNTMQESDWSVVVIEPRYVCISKI